MLLVLFNTINKWIASYTPLTAAKISMLSTMLIAICLISL